MSNAELKADLARADLLRDLAHVREARKRQFAAIVRFVRRREAKGPAKEMMEQIRRDNQLCKLLVDYEDESEIIGVMEFVIDPEIWERAPVDIRQSRREVRNKRKE